ncbi:hypothetical protein CAI21_21890 [Alkalilimnicola ehrlichii]|uniref:Uncharacterized protein n=2 Tax=Alkalilimnicola ehrlichii TaxID=351052 RepID=A0A3E0WFX3_9GAMM|nr:hypothetical protein CAI21_21890 [Alkalilimnicola ehrlichii]RFA31628.1 hypothetical protein CAL65_22035 [Alkalilimnicola ehrlichii]
MLRYNALFGLLAVYLSVLSVMRDRKPNRFLFNYLLHKGGGSAAEVAERLLSRARVMGIEPLPDSLSGRKLTHWARGEQRVSPWAYYAVLPEALDAGYQPQDTNDAEALVVLWLRNHRKELDDRYVNDVAALWQAVRPQLFAALPLTEFADAAEQAALAQLQAWYK